MSLPDSIPASAPGEGATNANASAETTPAATPAASTPPAASAMPAPGAPPDPNAPAVTPAPSWSPNFKYKAALQEKEIEEFWRPLIKDKDSEEKVKKLFSKVDAFDYMSEKKAHFEKQFNDANEYYNDMQGTVQKFNSAIKSDDLTSAFRVAGISRDQVFKWTQQQLQIMDLPPEQQAMYAKAEQAQQQKSVLEEQIASLQNRFEDQAVQTRTMRLEQSLLRPDVARFSEAWDQNAQQQGAFREFVIQEARREWFETKQDIPPEQAIERVMQRFGKFLNVGNSPSQTVPTSAPRAAPPVIPNIQGKAASPIKKVAKNMDELNKAIKERLSGISGE